MRTWLLATTLAVSLSACMAPAPAALSAGPEMDGPLDARLFPPYYGQVAVRLTRPAYVALFEIIPGRGASLLYPQSGTGFTQVRESWVPMRYNPQRWLYASEMSSFASNRSWLSSYGTGLNSGYTPRQQAPRYLFLVASERPLDVQQFQESLSGVRSYLGHARYASYQPYDVMEQLAYAMLPYTSEQGWVTDVYVDWGYDWGYGSGAGMTAAQASYQPVRCANGAVMFARYIAGWGFESLPCVPYNYSQGHNQRPPIGQPGDPQPPVEPSDSGGRTRVDEPSDTTRERVKPGPSATVDVLAPEAARQRITELRAQVLRERWSEETGVQLKRDITTRQRMAVLRGELVPPSTRDATRGTPARGQSSAARADAERSARERQRSTERARDAERARERSDRTQPGSARGGASTSRAPESRPAEPSSAGERSRTGSGSPSSSGRSRVP